MEYVSIDAPFEKTLDYVSDARLLCEWAVNFLKTLEYSTSGIHKVTTPFGESTLKLRVDRALGVVDHVFNPGTEKESIVPTRVVSLTPERSAYLFCLPLPEMPKEEIDKALDGLSEELEVVKNNIEKI